jgi:hypothetical protein
MVLPTNPLFLSQILPATASATPAESLVGVIAGNLDRRFRSTGVQNVLDFGADPNFNLDSTNAINIAIAAAAALGSTTQGNHKGGTVFFPPGSYLVSGSLANNTSSTSVRLLGSGVSSTLIRGTVTGFVIQGSADGVGGVITAIEDLSVRNDNTSSGFDLTTGAIHYGGSFATNQCYVKNVQYAGWSGIVAFFNCFENAFINCGSTGRGSAFWNSDTGVAPYVSGQVGMCIAGAVCIGCTALGYAVGMVMYGWKTDFIGSRTESSALGVLVGLSLPGTTAMQNSPSACSIIGHSTERCDTSMLIWSGQIVVNGLALTGTIGTAKFSITTGTTWSAGTATIVSSIPLANFGWTSGTRQVMLEQITSSNNPTAAPGYGFNPPKGSPVTATWASATSFTYPLANDPGSYTGGVNPNTMNWSFQIEYGLRIRSPGLSKFDSVSVVTVAQFAGIDLYVDGNGVGGSAGGATMIGCAAGSSGWIMPSPPQKSSYQFSQCDQPTGSELDAAGRVSGMLFANIPGNGISTAQMFPPAEGMQYDIIDSATAAVSGFATAVFSGTGSSANHVRLRCSSSPINTQATLSNGTEAIFTATIGASFMATTNGTNIINVTTIGGGWISAGDTIIGTNIPAATTVQPYGTGGTTGTGGIGTYSLSASATGSASGTIMQAQTNVLNVTAPPSFGTITANGTWSLDLYFPTNGQLTTVLVNSQIAGTPGGQGQYQLSGPQITAAQLAANAVIPGVLGPITMGAGIAGTTLTLHGTTAGTFAVNDITRMNNTSGYKLTVSLGGSPAQWTVSGASAFRGPQVLSAGLWTICG